MDKKISLALSAGIALYALAIILRYIQGNLTGSQLILILMASFVTGATKWIGSPEEIRTPVVGSKAREQIKDRLPPPEPKGPQPEPNLLGVPMDIPHIPLTAPEPRLKQAVLATPPPEQTVSKSQPQPEIFPSTTRESGSPRKGQLLARAQF